MEQAMSTDCSYLVEQAGFSYPPIGLYITPDPAPFEPLVRPVEGKWACVYMFFKRWLKGESVHLTATNFGCGGIGSYLFGVQQRSREEMIEFSYQTLLERCSEKANKIRKEQRVGSG